MGIYKNLIYCFAITNAMQCKAMVHLYDAASLMETITDVSDDFSQNLTYNLINRNSAKSHLIA